MSARVTGVCHNTQQEPVLKPISAGTKFQEVYILKVKSWNI
jgi:hypothetical protein